MILLQLSAGQGPLECCQAVGLALKFVEKECNRRAIPYQLLQAIAADKRDCFKSVLLEFDPAKSQQDVRSFVNEWRGVMLWVCPSQFRPAHRRKNWYFSGCSFESDELIPSREIKFQTCRASGAGGQHVNTTDSAVQATHIETGISVRVESERSQHANKKLARILLDQKLEKQQQDQRAKQGQSHWQQHWELERGNPVKVFRGTKFLPS